MKRVSELLTLGVILAASLPRAQASPLTGTLTISGDVEAITHSLLDSSTFLSRSTEHDYALGSTSNLSDGGEVLLTVIKGILADVFAVSSVQTAPNGSLIYYGALSDGNPADNETGTFTLTPDATRDRGFQGSLNPMPAPEPTGILLLGTGLVGAAGLLFRKRRNQTK